MIEGVPVLPGVIATREYKAKATIIISIYSDDYVMKKYEYSINPLVYTANWRSYTS